MFTLEVENIVGTKLKLTQNENKYQILNIEGLTPPKAKITTSTIANFDGERFKNSKLEMRNIVLNVKIKGNIETNRITLYDFFDMGQLCKLYYSNGLRSVFIEGYCENINGDLFSQNQVLQISIICPDPYWKSLVATEINISQLSGGFEFPFSIDSEGISFSDFIENKEVLVVNRSDTECGLEIILTATATVSNPVIYNVRTGEYLKLNATLQNGEIIKINTNKGEKSIIKISNGNETNIINTLETKSTWLKLKKGSNSFTYDVSNSSNLNVIFRFNHLFKGV